MHILLVEDDSKIANYVERGLKESGHTCEVCTSGRDGLALAIQNDYSVVLVDRMLPELDGLTMVKAMRQANCTHPVLFLTSVGGLEDKVEGLEAGGDDYLVKPFAFLELMARINALARRPNIQANQLEFIAKDLRLDVVKRTVSRNGKLIDLKAREFSILELLLRNKGRIITRTMLLERIWDFNFEPNTSVVETQMSRLRSKVDKPFKEQLIKTVRNIGYTIRDDA